MNTALAMNYEDSILDEKVHGRLIADIERVASVANIPKRMIFQSMQKHCSADEMAWVKHFNSRDEEKPNLAYVTDNSKTPIDSRMMAVAGAFIRNFIDARVMTVQEVLALEKDGEMPEPTVLLIPNFFIGKSDGGHIAAWEVSTLLGLLMSRYSAGKATAIYVQDLGMLQSEYGKSFSTHVKSYYNLIK